MKMGSLLTILCHFQMGQKWKIIAYQIQKELIKGNICKCAQLSCA